MRNRKKLKFAFDAWAKTFNVAERWAKDEALRTLAYWHRDPDGRKSFSWNPIYQHSSRASSGERFEFLYEGWETELFTWSRYRKLVRQRFEKKLCEYEKVTRQRAESCGLVRSRRTHSQENFEWFALYQFMGLPSTEICRNRRTKHFGGDESSVLKGIKIAAELIGWNELRSRKIR